MHEHFIARMEVRIPYYDPTVEIYTIDMRDWFCKHILYAILISGHSTKRIWIKLRQLPGNQLVLDGISAMHSDEGFHICDDAVFKRRLFRDGLNDVYRICDKAEKAVSFLVQRRFPSIKTAQLWLTANDRSERNLTEHKLIGMAVMRAVKKSHRAAQVLQRLMPIAIKRVKAGRIIVRRVEMAFCDPSTELCRRRLLREFSELVEQ